MFVYCGNVGNRKNTFAVIAVASNNDPNNDYNLFRCYGKLSSRDYSTAH